MTALAVYLLSIAGVVTAEVLKGLAHQLHWEGMLVPFVACPTVGVVIAMKRPRNPIGQVFLAIGALLGVGVSAEALVELAVVRHWSCTGIVLAAAWVQLWYWYPLLVLTTAYPVLLFPSGLPSPRWRPLFGVLTALLAAITVAAALARYVDFGPHKVANPIGLHTSMKSVEDTTFFHVTSILLLACILASFGSVVLRYRRARDLERAQLKWFLLATTVLAVVLVADMLGHTVGQVANVLMPAALTGIPVACGLGIVRYRLYDIDRIVSRTISYAVVTATVVGVYVAIIGLTDSVLRFSSSVAVAASTLAAAAAFQPLRRRVQHLIDRRFDRAAYDATRIVEQFSGRLRDQVDADAVRADLLATASGAVAPSVLSLWVAP